MNFPSSAGWPNISTGTGSSQFFYDHNHQRWQQIASYSGSPETTEYIGGLTEKMSNASAIEFRNYIPVGNTMVVYEVSSAATAPSTYYAIQDHLGSTAVLTNQNGTLIAAEKYSATAINETSATQQTAAQGITRHEYTGQEGLDNLNLTNMNGRIFDSSGAGLVMFSPDPSIPDPTNTLSYNHYAYVNYNPLTYIDPSGYTCVGADVEHDCPPDDNATPADADVPTVVVNAPNNSFIPSVGDTVTSADGALSLTVTSAQQTAVDMAQVTVTANGSTGNQQSTVVLPGSAMSTTSGGSGVSGRAILGGSVAIGAPGYNYRRTILGNFGLSALPYVPGYDFANCIYGGGCGSAGWSMAAVGVLAAPEGIAARGGQTIVLGLRDFGTREVAQQLGAIHLLDHPEWMNALKTAIGNPSTKFIVNLEGFSGSSIYSQVMGAVQRGLTPAAKYTEWEMAQLYQAGRLGTVNFVNRVGQVLANPFE